MATPRKRLPSWRWEALRTTFWFVPTVLVVVAAVIFGVSFAIDVAAYYHHLQLPFWLHLGSADAGRDVLIAIAAAIITTVGVVFSVTILALTLASQQFGPRMMRNFVRDFGNQFTLGIFVASFVYSVLALGSISSYPHPHFVPHLCIAVAEILLLLDLAVLIYFINHIASSIQLPAVIAGIAHDLDVAIDKEFPKRDGEINPDAVISPREMRIQLQRPDELLDAVERRGGVILAAKSGYLQFVGYAQLTKIARLLDATIRLDYRPGHFIVAGQPIAKVFPQGAAQQVEAALAKSHVTGPHRTLMQDPVFAIDQLVEIAIRALSPAVNDTFTALTCLDWLSEGLCRLSQRELTNDLYRDEEGRIRLISAGWSYDRMIKRAYDKIREAAHGMPAVYIRMLDTISVVANATTSQLQRDSLINQSEMIMRGAEATVEEPNDLEDIKVRFDRATARLNPELNI
ncbi:MAG: DUF2254 domain-containing protein [Acidimicrobiales bacterium]